MERVKRVPTIEEDSEEEEMCNGKDSGSNGGGGPYHQVADDSDSDSSSSSSSSPAEYQRYHQTNYLDGAIPHIFLPKRLPDSVQPDLLDVEDWILQQFWEACQELEFPKLQSITKMLRTWQYLQPKLYFGQERFTERFSAEVSQMKIGDTIPIYVRQQNCTLIITKIDKEWFQLETFRASLPSETIMSNVGSLQVTFPETCDVIHNNALLSSQVFAKQLHELSVESFEISMKTSTKAGKEFIEYREVADPFLVSDWIVGLLAPSSSHHSHKSSTSFKIVKKVRDEVVCKRSAEAIPFRRSGLWTSLKVAVYLKLLQLVGNPNDAKIIYKTIVLKYLAGICKQYSERCDHKGTIDLDLACQMMTKLGQRVKKLQKMSCDKNSAFAKDIVQLWSSSIKFVHCVVSDIYVKVNQIWMAICPVPSANSNEEERITRFNEQFKGDLYHQIPWLEKYISTKDDNIKSKKVSNGNHFAVENLLPDSLQRYQTLESIMRPIETSMDILKGANKQVWLHDTENFIKSPQFDTLEDSKMILNLILAYVKNATPEYISTENPVGLSRMNLVLLKAIQLLDKIAVSKFPLLREYKSGITPGNFEKLLLPHGNDLKLLDKILDYFLERDNFAIHPGITDSSEISSQSFPVIYASTNTEMTSLRQKILSDIEVRVTEKLEEMEEACKKCNELLKQMEGKKESCSLCKHCTKKCDACSKLEADLEKKRFSVSVYERPLPQEDDLQWAVVFELLIPEEILNLREALAILKSEVFGQQKYRSSNSSPTKWMDYKSLQQYKAYHNHNSPKHGYQQQSAQQTMVNLSSKLLPTSSTHHTRIKNPDILSPETGSNDFVVNNGLDCFYHYKSPISGLILHAPNQFYTLQLKSTQIDFKSKYANLQWAVDNTTHSQNRIIAEVSSYHPELIAFGSVRAGHRLQLMNLYRYISGRELELEKEPVLALLLQTVWQTGPRDRKGVRESHLDFMDETNLEFALEFLEMLERTLECNDTNYANPWILMTVVVITTRVLELNKNNDCRNKCSELLTKCRKLAESWWGMIDFEIGKVDIKGNDEEVDETRLQDDKQGLHLLQLQIAICSAFSYNVSDSKELFPFIIENKEDLVHWFETISRLNHLTEDLKCHEMLSTFGKLLLNLASDVALYLNLEQRLIISDSIATLVQSLHLFSCRQWDMAAKSGITGWKQIEPESNIFIGKYEEESENDGETNFLSFDLVTGKFLVNGYPQSGIPPGIIQNHLFEVFFRGRSNIKVRGHRFQCLRTLDKFHGHYYEFEVISNRVIIKEVHEDGDYKKLELLEPEKFRNILGDDHIDDYTHWLDISKSTVYFRRVPTKESDYYLPHEFKLTKDERTNMWLLYDEHNKEFILSRKSQGFQLITNKLSRLELPRYINVVMDEKFDIITAKLPRYQDLSFKLENGYLYSVEYTGFKLASNQTSAGGTLAGLQHGILLEKPILSCDDLNESKVQHQVKRILIVSHGKLHIRQSHYHHQKTSIDLEHHLRQPPFFIYEYDSVLKRLKADKSKAAWLYLALLHAATSSPLPDPFTEMTGTEMAIQILQSGFVWSCSPYDEESLKTLKLLRGFSPRRYYYGHGMRIDKKKKGTGEITSLSSSDSEQIETTEWPAGLSPLSAYDGYAIAVDKLIEDSQRLAMLYQGIPPQETRKGSLENSSEKLQIRAYYRHLNSYNKAALLKKHYFKTSTEKLNEGGNVLECVVRQERKKVETRNELFYLNGLLSMSQTRFMNKLQEPIGNLSNRKSNLSSFILTEESLLCSEAKSSLPDWSNITLKELLDSPSDFHRNWLRFYDMAVTWKGDKSEEEPHLFTLELSALAYQGAPIEQILNLHNINVLSQTMEFPRLPSSVIASNEIFTDPISCEFSEVKIKRFLVDRARPLLACYRDEEKLKGQEKKMDIEEKADYVVGELKKMWPCAWVPKKKIEEMHEQTKLLWSVEELRTVSGIMGNWYRNSKLQQFVQSVEKILDKFYEHLPPQRDTCRQYQFCDKLNESPLEVKLVVTSELVGSEDERYFEDFESLNIAGELEEAAIIFYSGSGFQETNNETMVETQRHQCLSKIEGYALKIQKSIQTTSSSKQVIFMAGLAPRTSPILLLRYLLFSLKTRTRNNALVKLVGALAVLWAELKRFNRCLTLKAKGSTAVQELKSELNNTGHENWSPVENPEWLLLELELDLMIRPIQVDVARQMIQMPGDNKNGNANGVMQLNMGEGKTSVIVPMLCATLAGVESLCRVTVLHSIFKTNLSILSFAIGGLLNRRVYTFPCRRDMNIDEACAESILGCYQECMRLKGVVLTLPEHRLSFRLMAYDKTLKGYPDHGVKFLEIENGLRKYVRDILDESDELLNVKYQLVYTIGTQVTVDGGKLRWTTCQKLLGIVQLISERFLGKVGPTCFEYHKELYSEHPEVFPQIRIVDSSALEEFLDIVADEVLKEFKLTERQKQVVKKFLTQDNISLENFKFVMGLFKNDTDQLEEIRLLSGYLQRGILGLALSKRWRVEYGVDPRGHRRMAVPFRAKDCAAERTEFGHPDLAIVLTQLSYYYSGLSDLQLKDAFEILKSKPEAEMIYSSWMQKIAPEKVVKFLLSFSSLNLQDCHQRSHLFSMLRKHKSVVDFWLSHKVFPFECKQFPGKITMTAWDLCYERSRHPISGFSGTNDSSILLPLPITQQDLPKLRDTNLKMEQTLLKPENNAGHKGFPIGVTCREILEEIKKDSLKILIDAGALMLECDNEQVAQLWLEVDPSIEAIVYFSKDNELLIKCRHIHHQTDNSNKKFLSRHNKIRERDIQLELSPYRDRLDKCCVFLDDQHTRGTDLKFPTGSKACVTVGSRMRRDKLMQACMRMRNLGSGHSVSFYLSHEAFTKVLHLKRECSGGQEPTSGKKSSKKKKNRSSNNVSIPTTTDDKSVGDTTVTTQDVINWVVKNTQEYNHDGLVHWAISGKNYAQKLVAQDFHDMVDTHPLEKLHTLANQCVDEEVLLIKDLYGTYSEVELLVKLIPEWFEKTQQKLLGVVGCYALSQRIMRRFDSIRDEVKHRCQTHIPEKYHMSSSSMEEEQEKELELENETEMEEERQLVPPSKVDYMEESTQVHENVKNVVVKGEGIGVKPGIARLCDIFEKTSFWKQVQPECWSGGNGSDQVFATQEFISVISAYESYKFDEEPNFKTDLYLRPIEFIVSLPKSRQFLVLSPFEVNELMPYFRNGKVATQLHMFSPRRFLNQDLLLNTIPLQLPRGSLRLIPEESKSLAALLVASGNLYFGSMEEQKAYARFLALVPRPWSQEQQLAFEKEMIKKSGFLLPKYRKQEMDNCQIEMGAFQKDPIAMVKKILTCRQPIVISEVTHVSRLLNQNWYVDLP